MAKYELDRKDLESLLRGTQPYYNIISHPKIKDFGSFNGERWFWINLDKVSDSELFDMYHMCKRSWQDDIHPSTKISGNLWEPKSSEEIMEDMRSYVNNATK